MVICWRCVIPLSNSQVKSRVFSLNHENLNLGLYFRQFLKDFSKLKNGLKITFEKPLSCLMSFTSKDMWGLNGFFRVIFGSKLVICLGSKMDKIRENGLIRFGTYLRLFCP